MKAPPHITNNANMTWSTAARFFRAFFALHVHDNYPAPPAAAKAKRGVIHNRTDEDFSKFNKVMGRLWV